MSCIYALVLGDIEIQYYDYCQQIKDIAIIANIALEYLNGAHQQCVLWVTVLID